MAAAAFAAVGVGVPKQLRGLIRFPCRHRKRKAVVQLDDDDDDQQHQQDIALAVDHHDPLET